MAPAESHPEPPPRRMRRRIGLALAVVAAIAAVLWGLPRAGDARDPDLLLEDESATEGVIEPTAEESNDTVVSVWVIVVGGTILLVFVVVGGMWQWTRPIDDGPPEWYRHLDDDDV